MTVASESQAPNVFHWLDSIRLAPIQYAQSLKQVESLIWGYCAALGEHQLVESVPSMGRHFLYWVGHRTGWGVSRGWAYAIEKRMPEFDRQVAKLFSLIDEYRQFTPTAICTVTLKERHQPTGKKVRLYVNGISQRMDRPECVEIYQYAPEPIYFLRLFYPEHIDDRYIYFDSTLASVRAWIRDELRVKSNEWQRVTT